MEMQCARLINAKDDGIESRTSREVEAYNHEKFVYKQQKSRASYHIKDVLTVHF